MLNRLDLSLFCPDTSSKRGLSIFPSLFLYFFQKQKHLFKLGYLHVKDSNAAEHSVDSDNYLIRSDLSIAMRCNTCAMTFISQRVSNREESVLARIHQLHVL